MIVDATIVGRQVILRKCASNFMERRRSWNAPEDSKVPYKGVLIKHHLTLKVRKSHLSLKQQRRSHLSAKKSWNVYKLSWTDLVRHLTLVP